MKTASKPNMKAITYTELHIMRKCSNDKQCPPISSSGHGTEEIVGPIPVRRGPMSARNLVHHLSHVGQRATAPVGTCWNGPGPGTTTGAPDPRLIPTDVRLKREE